MIDRIKDNSNEETFYISWKNSEEVAYVKSIKGKKSITNYETLEVFENENTPTLSLLECKLETGRTHQIRVHMKYKNASLLGDNQYGKKNIKFKKINENFFTKLSDLKGQALHAKSLGFIHPTKKKWMNFDSNLPNDFKKLLNLLKKLSG